MKTIHQRATELLRIYRWRFEEWGDSHPKCPKWIADRVVAAKRKAVLRRCAKEAVSQSSHKLTAEQHTRRQQSRQELGAIARGLRRDTGLCGTALRNLTNAVREKRYCRAVDLTAVDAVPDSALAGLVGKIRETGVYEENTGIYTHKWTKAWADDGGTQGLNKLLLMALTDAVRMDIGELDARRMLARLAADSSAKIGGYLACDLMRWLAGENQHAGSYETCSGGEHYTWFRSHPEHWPLLASRMPVGQVGKTRVQVLPHEHAKADACAKAGLFHTFRMSDSIYSGSEEQVSSALAALAA